jgi:hypothetical protein
MHFANEAGPNHRDVQSCFGHGHSYPASKAAAHSANAWERIKTSG